MSEFSESTPGPVIEAPVSEAEAPPVVTQDAQPGTPAPKKLIKPGGKGGRRGRSTKAEMDRERMTALVITCLVAGKTTPQIADELGLSEGTVIRIRGELPQDFIEYFSAAKTNEISALIEDGLKAQLLALRKIVEVTNDEVWLKGQRAPELATFFGVVSDKTVRVLAAIERANDREQPHVPQPRESAAAPGGVRPTAARPTQEVRLNA